MKTFIVIITDYGYDCYHYHHYCNLLLLLHTRHKIQLTLSTTTLLGFFITLATGSVSLSAALDSVDE